MGNDVVVVLVAAIAVALGCWLAYLVSRRWRLKVLAALGVAALSVVVAFIAYLAVVAGAFTLLEGRGAANPAPAWATWLVGAAMLAAAAVVVFGVATIAIAVWRAVSSARRKSSAD